MASKQYLNNKDLYKEIIISKEMGKLTKEGERMLYLLGKNIIKRFYYSNPDDRMDTFQEGMFQLYRNWHTFDEGKSNNPFALYTEIFKRGAAAGFNKLHIKKGDEYMRSKTVSIHNFYEDGRDLDI